MRTRSQLEARLIALAEEATTLAHKIARQSRYRTRAQILGDQMLYVLDREIEEIAHDLEVMAAAEMVE